MDKLTKSGHETEPVNFNKDIFDTYSTSFPVTTVEYKFSEYQVERMVEKEKDDRPDFQGPPISFHSPKVDHQLSELVDNHYLKFAVFCYKYWKYVATAQDSVNIILNKMLSSPVQ